MCCIVPTKAIALCYKSNIMTLDLNFYKAVVIAVLLTMGVAYTAKSEVKPAATSVEIDPIQVAPSFFESLVQSNF
jgi:hypothetical protein